MIVSMRKMEKILIGKLGFLPSNGSHRFYNLFDRDGKFIVKTMLSQGSGGKDIDKGIFGAIARQTQLTKKQLQDAIDCPLSRKDYSNILKEKNLIDSDLP